MVTMTDALGLTDDLQVGEALRRGYTLPATCSIRGGAAPLDR
jgi:hypothetical protein